MYITVFLRPAVQCYLAVCGEKLPRSTDQTIDAVVMTNSHKQALELCHLLFRSLLNENLSKVKLPYLKSTPLLWNNDYKLKNLLSFM